MNVRTAVEVLLHALHTVRYVAHVWATFMVSA